MIHHTHSYIRNPLHKITIDLVGMGGTGSQVLTGLARINEALAALNHPGIYVRAWDPDEVNAANMGRQLFSRADLGLNKAMVLIQRVNRFFGTDWQSMPVKYTGAATSNILITCVDSAAARLQIGKKLGNKSRRQPTDQLYYWLDIGNLQKTGQCILGTVLLSDAKGEGVVRKLKNVIQFFPELRRIREEKQGPSCSLAEALEKQDLFINSTIAQFGCNLIWKLLREGSVKYHGCYLNIETLSVNAIRIK